MENETMQTTEITEQTGEETTVTPEDDETPETSSDAVVETDGEVVTAEENEVKGETTVSEPAAEELIFSPVYKGTVTPIKASNTEEVTTLLQLGMKQREFLPVYEQLEQLAHESGAKSVAEFVKGAFEHNEEKHRNEAISLYGKDEGEKFYQYKKAERGKAFSRYQQQAANAEQEVIKNRNEELANQFIEMQAEYPEYAAFKDVPKEVIEMSINKGIHLMDALARYKRAEDKKTAQAAASAKKAAAATTGSMSDAADSGSDPLWAAYQSGANR